jgi:hypothetical protein
MSGRPPSVPRGGCGRRCCAPSGTFDVIASNLSERTAAGVSGKAATPGSTHDNTNLEHTSHPRGLADDDDAGQGGPHLCPRKARWQQGPRRAMGAQPRDGSRPPRRRLPCQGARRGRRKQRRGPLHGRSRTRWHDRGVRPRRRRDERRSRARGCPASARAEVPRDRRAEGLREALRRAGRLTHARPPGSDGAQRRRHVRPIGATVLERACRLTPGSGAVAACANSRLGQANCAQIRSDAVRPSATSTVCAFSAWPILAQARFARP